MRLLICTLCLAALPLFVSAQYKLLQEYAGATFFDRWEFYDNYDNLTHGDAIFVSKQVASFSKLAYVNDVGHAIIKVDNTSTVSAGQKRNTIRIQSSDVYSVGSLWIADMIHAPYGCSVWGAWWSSAPNWPKSGEIDTFEGVNQVTGNAMALHTKPGCTLDQVNSSYSGVMNSTDCSYLFNANEGCSIRNPDPKSYGAEFAKAGGGVFVTEFSDHAINIWFFTRSQVPPSLRNLTTHFNTSGLGQPVANFPMNTHTCNSTFFDPQHLTIDITLCGDFAGNPDTFGQTCSGVCYDDYVIGPPSTYDNAYFEIKTIRTYYDPRFPQAKADTQPVSIVAQKPGPTFTGVPYSHGTREFTSRNLANSLVMASLAALVGACMTIFL